MDIATVGVDPSGIWTDYYDEDNYHHFAWADIASILAVRYDCKTRTELIIEIMLVSGHLIEINESHGGFNDFCDGLQRQFNLLPNWFDAIDAMQPGDDAIVIWEASS